ncbi:MAG: hypothetical protein AB7F86_06315 [Bdellovibrionales bacterium]
MKSRWLVFSLILWTISAQALNGNRTLVFNQIGDWSSTEIDPRTFDGMLLGGPSYLITRKSTGEYAIPVKVFVNHAQVLNANSEADWAKAIFKQKANTLRDRLKNQKLTTRAGEKYYIAEVAADPSSSLLGGLFLARQIDGMLVITVYEDSEDAFKRNRPQVLSLFQTLTIEAK